MTHGVTPLSLDAMPLCSTRALMRQEAVDGDKRTLDKSLVRL